MTAMRAVRVCGHGEGGARGRRWGVRSAGPVDLSALPAGLQYLYVDNNQLTGVHPPAAATHAIRTVCADSCECTHRPPGWQLREAAIGDPGMQKSSDMQSHKRGRAKQNQVKPGFNGPA